MGHLLYLMFRCDFDVMENLESLEEFGDVNTPLEGFYSGRQWLPEISGLWLPEISFLYNVLRRYDDYTV